MHAFHAEFPESSHKHRTAQFPGKFNVTYSVQAIAKPIRQSMRILSFGSHANYTDNNINFNTLIIFKSTSLSLFLCDAEFLLAYSPTGTAASDSASTYVKCFVALAAQKKKEGGENISSSSSSSCGEALEKETRRCMAHSVDC